MVTTVSTNTIRQNVDQFLDSIQKPDQTMIVEDRGTRIAIVMSPDEYDRLRDLEAAADWAIIDEARSRNDHLDPDEVLAEVTAIVEEVRQERYDAEQQRLAAEGGH